VPGDCDVLVIGAGVSGLTTGICLAEQGWRVRAWAAEPPQRTTSAVAGAVWGPHLVEESERAARWAAETLDVLRGLAGRPGAGVRIAWGVQAGRGELPPQPAGLAGARRCGPGELPPGFSHGWRYPAPLLHMPTYLGYLLARFRRAGGRLRRVTVSSLSDAAREGGARVLVNCAGMGARDLARDPDLVPVRGQVVVTANPGLEEFFIGLGDGTAPLVYVFPHGEVAVLGGTEEAGDWSRVPDPGTARRILRDCTAAEPRLARARVIGHRVGLRPARPTVRLEAEPGGLPVVHNYGHGGAGVTLSWGCAREAARLAREACGQPAR
jgi:D-amino-acid oxidase